MNRRGEDEASASNCPDVDDPQHREAPTSRWFKRRPFDPRDFVTPDAFSVQPALLGTPLAKPRKRLFAWAIDALLVVLISQLSNILLALALALLCDRILRQTEFPIGDRWRQHLRIILVIGFVAWAAMQAQSRWRERHAATPATELKSTVKGTAAAADTSADAAADDSKGEQLTDAERIDDLNKKIEVLQKHRNFSLIDSAKNLLGDIGFDFGWAAIYWTLLTAWWNGQTPGKRLFGLRVVQLNGKPLTMWDSFNRCGGYAAGVATGLLGFAQVFWDPNRQAIHDKVSFTVVVDERRPKMSWPIEQLARRAAR